MEVVTDAAVRLEGASKSYGSVRALEGMDFATREIVAILGPNGAGKTTAISLINRTEAARLAERQGLL